MVKMSVGQAMSQKSSLQALIAHQAGSYSQLEQALNQFISSTPNLKGVTYESAKSYASQVLLPLVRGSILLSEAVGSSTDAYVSGYLSQCGGTDLDSEDLERQIAQCDRQLKQLNLYLSDLSDDDRPNPSALSSLTNQINLIGKTRQRLYDQLRKLHAFNASSTTYFSDLAALRSAVQQGISQAQLWWQSGSQTFVHPHGQDMLWAGFLNAKWEETQALALIEKVEAGKDLSRTELNELAGYLVDNPESKLYDKGMSAFLRSFKLEVEGGEEVSYAMDVSGGVAVTIQSARTMSLEKQYIKNKKITIDSAGNVKVGNKLLYNKQIGKVYNANQSNAKHGRFISKTPESIKYQIKFGHDIDTMATSIGKLRNLDDATAALKANFTSSLKFWDDFDWSTKNISNIGKFGKVAKSIGLAGTVFQIGTNLHEHFIDDKTSPNGEKLRNFAMDQGVDLAVGTGATAVGAAVGGFLGTFIPIPGAGTVIGVAAGMYLGHLIDNYDLDFLGGKSVSEATKDTLTDFFGG